MHIALLTDGISPFVTGGMQRHSYHLAKKLLARGVKITLVHAVDHSDEIPSEGTVKEVLNAPEGMLSVVGLHFPKGMRMPGHYLRESYQYSCAIFEALKDEWVKFDFIYAKGFSAWCLLERKKKGFHSAPVGVKFHGYEMFQKSANLKGRLEQYMLRPPVVFNNRNANVVFSYGGQITEIIRKIGVAENQIIEIGSGVDDNWIVNEPKPESYVRKFIFVGRDERRKGVKELMAVSDVFAETKTEMHWVGPVYQSKATANNFHYFHGEIRDSEELKSIIDKCQVLIAPSHSEGMPNVILEAMARGLAVISTKVGAIPDMISDINGRLIPPANEKLLQKAIRQLAEMPEDELMKLRMESIKLVNQKFSWDSVADKTLEAIRRVTYSINQLEKENQKTS
ncbi:glycosyltransferase family 4 protein [Cryomorpha ignava]|uniref:Glycosyltransferase family 4 protein n=1 Tax=Cryomorpha ignava TaxID=101383 RepID=A0A7K3WQT6_9FLAO|nr:glycosyltransferase family 4 protein [Cryomorpha ignava]NEN24049.1 glycosyltransferase family 4 protein [Cryomorpha ignava]